MVRARRARYLRSRPPDELRTLNQGPRHWNSRLWSAGLCSAVWITPAPSAALDADDCCGFWYFGAIFAVNSALHSYLILSFTEASGSRWRWGSTIWPNAADVWRARLRIGVSPTRLAGWRCCLATAAFMLRLSALDGTAAPTQNLIRDGARGSTPARPLFQALQHAVAVVTPESPRRSGPTRTPPISVVNSRGKLNANPRIPSGRRSQGRTMADAQQIASSPRQQRDANDDRRQHIDQRRQIPSYYLMSLGCYNIKKQRQK